MILVKFGFGFHELFAVPSAPAASAARMDGISLI